MDMASTVVGGWMLSLVALVATAAVTVVLARRRNEAESPLSATAAYTVGMYVTVFLLVLSQELAGLAGSEGSPIVIDSLFGSLQMFGLNRDIELDAGALEWMGAALPAYLAYNAVLYLAAPIGTLSVIIALLGRVFGMTRVSLLARKRDAYVLSSLNETSLILAASAKERGGKRCLVVFANASDGENDLIGKAKDAGAICVPQTVAYIAGRLPESAAHERVYVFSDADEAGNLNDAVELTRALAARWREGVRVPRVLAFSSSPVGGSVVDAVLTDVNREAPTGAEGQAPSRLQMRVRLERVDWIRNTVDTMLDAYPLFLTGVREESLAAGTGAYRPDLLFDYGPDSRRVLVVGDGPFVGEFLKGAVWASQMGGIRFRIDVAVPDAEAFKSRLAFDAPMLFGEGGFFGDGVDRDGNGGAYRPRLDVHYEQLDPEGAGYLDFLLHSEGGEFTYVLVALEDDLTCAKVARRTREKLEQRRLANGADAGAPAFIAAVIRGEELAESLRLMRARNHLYAIEPVGQARDTFGFDAVFNPRLGAIARNVNRLYSEWSISAALRQPGQAQSAFARSVREADVAFANSEYNQRSSIASALHRKYSLFTVCRDAGVLPDDASIWTLPLDKMRAAGDGERLFGTFAQRYGAERQRLAAIEHDRWSAYVMTEGYEHEGASRIAAVWNRSARQNYDLARLHSCLVGFEELDGLDRALVELKKRDYEHRGETAPGDDELNPHFKQLDDNVIGSLDLIASDDESPELDSFRTLWLERFSVA